jgi:hypothetical protein
MPGQHSNSSTCHRVRQSAAMHAAMRVLGVCQTGTAAFLEARPARTHQHGRCAASNLGELPHLDGGPQQRERLGLCWYCWRWRCRRACNRLPPAWLKLQPSVQSTVKAHQQPAVCVRQPLRAGRVAGAAAAAASPHEEEAVPPCPCMRAWGERASVRTCSVAWNHTPASATHTRAYC